MYWSFFEQKRSHPHVEQRTVVSGREIDKIHEIHHHVTIGYVVSTKFL